MRVIDKDTWETHGARVPLKTWADDIELRKAKPKDVAEECRQAYKDIDAVMASQMGLVRITHRLRPLAVVKG